MWWLGYSQEALKSETLKTAWAEATAAAETAATKNFILTD